MISTKLQRAKDKLERALQRLKEAVEDPLDPQKKNVDLTIHRFEFSFELFWKFLKVLLEAKGVISPYPRLVLEEAYKGNLIEDMTKWEEMLKARNNVSHTYDEALAQIIYNDIKQIYFPLMWEHFERLKKEL